MFAKKYFLISIVILPLVFWLSAQVARASIAQVYFFYGDGCPHCAKEEIFLEELKIQNPDLKIEYLEVWYNKENVRLLTRVGEVLKADVSGVPFTLVGENYISGFSTAEITGKQIRNLIDTCRTADCPDVVGAIRRGEQVDLKSSQLPDNQPGAVAQVPEKIKVPFWGDLNIESVSLPVLTIVIGLLDGFNPCAMWVLVFLIGFLIGVEDKKKRWLLGIVFLATSAFAYFLFMAAWLKILLFLGFIIWVRVGIGILALGGGILNIREYWKNPTGACKVTKPKERKLVFEKLKEIVLKRRLLFALGGIIVLAFAVNLVELICSAGLPAVYTQILALSNLASWQYYVYLLLYILIFLIDDIIVFVVAMVTLEITGVSSKYSRYASLIGGVIMLIIGLLLLIRPEFLMFG